MSEKIWIELEPTTDEEIGRRRAEQANILLRKLGGTPGFEWQSYRHYIGTSGYVWVNEDHTYEELTDNGKWLNLTYLATGSVS